jgi:excisionase family DNA binding protein
MEKLLSIDDLTEMLGVTKATIYSWTSQNKIPHIKLSKRLLKFRENDIIDWISKKSNNSESSVVGKHNNRTRRSINPRDDGIERIIRNAKEEILHGS